MMLYNITRKCLIFHFYILAYDANAKLKLLIIRST